MDLAAHGDGGVASSKGRSKSEHEYLEHHGLGGFKGKLPEVQQTLPRSGFRCYREVDDRNSTGLLQTSLMDCLVPSSCHVAFVRLGRA